MRDQLPEIGDFFLLPPEPDQEGDKDWRPHVVLSYVTEQSPTVILAYSSTQSTQADLGAQFILLEPGAEGFAGTGLDRPTYVYPSLLVVLEPQELITHPHIGSLSGNPLTALRNAVPRALGFSTGTCRDAGAATGSLRGAVLQFSPAGRDRVSAEYAVVVTDPVFSRQGESLNIIPIVDANKVESQPPDLVFEGRDWIEPLRGMTRVLVFTRLVQAVRVRPDISRMLPPHVDAAAMREIDFALRSLFLTPEELSHVEARGQGTSGGLG
jgi:hypothetical protein